MSQPHWPAEVTPTPRRGLGLGLGAGIGTLVGLLGPVLLGLLGWAATSWLDGQSADSLLGLVFIAVVSIPVLLLVGGCILMIPDLLRGWGVACLVASGVWLISSAGVCTVFLFGALASYDPYAMFLR